QSVEDAARTVIELRFDVTNEIEMERSYDRFVLGSMPYRWPDLWKGRDGVRILLVRGEPATGSDLPLGDLHVPEKQKVVLRHHLGLLTGQDGAPFYGEILPSQVDTRRSTQNRPVQESADLRALTWGDPVRPPILLFAARQRLYPTPT